MANRIHVVTHEDGWAVKREGESSPESTYDTQREAIGAAHEVADKDGVDIVVHKRDGSFRNVLSPEADRNGGKKAKVQPEDVFSVGSRISWGAIFAGAVVALTVYLAFSALAAAVGLTVSANPDGESLALGAMIVWTVVCLASMFLGGYVTSRTTAGETSTEAAVYGVVLWGTLFVGITALAGLGIGLGAEMLKADAVPAEVADTGRLDEALAKAELPDEQVKKFRKTYDEVNARAEDATPTSVAWWAFAAVMLSMGAAVVGSLAGSGPDFYFAKRASGAVDVTTGDPKS